MMKNYLEMVQSVERDREALIFSDHVYTYGNLVDLALEQQRRLQTTPGFFAYLRVGDGCNNCCTYCAIPSIRGIRTSVISRSGGYRSAGCFF